MPPSKVGCQCRKSLRFLSQQRFATTTRPRWASTSSLCSALIPSALLSLHLEDIVKPVKKVAGEHRVLVIAPFEREKSTTTGYFDETVVLDDDVLPELGQLLYDQANGRAVALGHTAA